MKITDLLIDSKSLGNKLWLVDVVPVYEYKDNSRTENITAHRYTIAMPEKELDKINVKIDGKKLMDKPEGYVEVSFSNLEVFIYWLNGRPEVGAKATGISLVNSKQ